MLGGFWIGSWDLCFFDVGFVVEVSGFGVKVFGFTACAVGVHLKWRV